VNTHEQSVTCQEAFTAAKVCKVSQQILSMFNEIKVFLDEMRE
jgi:hypothetical protein